MERQCFSAHTKIPSGARIFVGSSPYQVLLRNAVKFTKRLFTHYGELSEKMIFKNVTFARIRVYVTCGLTYE